MKEIEKIIQFHDTVDWREEKTAIGTVVNVAESAYRRIGARIYVKSKGEWAGGISGGCLEGDALKKAKMAILRNQSSIVIYDTMDDDDHQIGVGLGCNGRIEVMFSPIEPTDPNNHIEILRKLVNKRSPSLLLQILRAPKPKKAFEGKLYTIERLQECSSDTNIAKQIIYEKMEEVILNKNSKVLVIKTKEGARFEILFEYIKPKIKLICVGDNYDVLSLLKISNELGWENHVIGKKSKFGKQVFANSFALYGFEEFDQIDIDPFSIILLMSHDYAKDLFFLKHFIKSEVPYIGLLGPKKRMLKMQSEMGLDLEAMPHLFAPTGLDIGAESPEEIALSIIAEIVAVCRKKEGHFLKNKIGPIHNRN